MSPRLGVRFELLADGELRLWRPDGQPLESYQAVAQRADQAEQQAERLAQRLRALGLDPEDLG
nr:hypothetical protein [Anthocerotibacter panamensis]